MPINFDQLPKSNPFGLIPKGYFKATISSAKMVPVKSRPGAMQLAVTYNLVGANGRKAGNYFDYFQESDKPFQQYKLGRFISALGLQFSGVVELKDIAKVLPNKQCIIEIDHQQDSRFKDDPTKVQASVKLYGSEGYWPVSEWNSLISSSGIEPDASAAQSEGESNADEDPFPADEALEDGDSDETEY